MPRSALPEHLNDPDEIDKAFPDDSDLGKFWRWFKKTTKTWFVFGPRATEWWARWREFPIVLAKVGGKGKWRWENDFTSWLSDVRFPLCYLSRVQYEKTWHVQLQWPLFFLIQIGNWEAYTGFKRDADKVYWLAFYLGKIWK